jgi:subtilisin family serine protease
LLNYKDSSNYNTYSSGTSLSTAFVTGVVSLLLSQNPSLTPEQIRTILRESADDQVGDPSEDTPGWDRYYGAGRLNAYKALLRVSRTKGTPRLTLHVPVQPRKTVCLGMMVPGQPYAAVPVYNPAGKTLPLAPRTAPGGVYLFRDR